MHDLDKLMDMHMQDGDIMHQPIPMLDGEGRTYATVTVSVYGTSALKCRNTVL